MKRDQIVTPTPTTDEIEATLRDLIQAGELAMERQRQGNDGTVDKFVVYAEPVLEKAMHDLKIR
jgi:hypothetical protein